MPEPNPNDEILDNVVEIETNPDEDDEMPEGAAEGGNLSVAMTVLAQSAAAGSARRTDAADQLASDSQRMWSIAMTSPTVMAAHGMRVASEAGSGRTRVESNTPAGSQITGTV